jgi:rRNA maturation protein Nop10
MSTAKASSRRQSGPNLRVAAPPRSSDEDQYGLLAGLIR